MNNKEENLKKWIRIHNLPKEFPLFPEDENSPSQTLFLRDNRAELYDILDTIQGSPRLQVLFPPGQGATTILRELIRMLKEVKPRSHNLFVPVDPCTHFQEDDFQAAFCRGVVSDIFHQLIGDHWEAALYGTRRQQFFQLLNIKDSEALESIHYNLYRGNEGEKKGAQERIRTMAGGYFDNLSGLISFLYEKLGLSVFLCFDFPHNVEEDVLYETFGTMKWFDEQEKNKRKNAEGQSTFPAAALSEIYFMTEEQAQTAQAVWARDYNTFAFPEYNEAEVFSIMAARFQPVSVGKAVHLSTALAPEFVKRVWGSQKPLRRMMEEMKTLLLESLDMDSGHVPFNLRPKDENDD